MASASQPALHSWRCKVCAGADVDASAHTIVQVRYASTAGERERDLLGLWKPRSLVVLAIQRSGSHFLAFDQSGSIARTDPNSRIAGPHAVSAEACRAGRGRVWVLFWRNGRARIIDRAGLECDLLERAGRGRTRLCAEVARRQSERIDAASTMRFARPCCWRGKTRSSPTRQVTTPRGGASRVGRSSPATTGHHQAILQDDRDAPAPPVAVQCEPAPLS